MFMEARLSRSVSLYYVGLFQLKTTKYQRPVFWLWRLNFGWRLLKASLLVVEAKLEHRAVYIKLNNERMYLMYFFL